METINKYCIDLNVECFPDILTVLKAAQDQHKKYLNVFKHYENTGPYPHFSGFLNQYNVGIFSSEIFYSPPGYCALPIHTDSGDVEKNHCRFNWVFGGKGSKMYWWKPKEHFNTVPILTDAGTLYITYKEEQCDLLWEAEVGCPSLVNVGVAHSARNPTNEGRWNMSYMLTDLETNEILQWDKAEKIFASLAQG